MPSSGPLVLICIQDRALARAVSEALFEHELELRVEVCRSADDLVERCRKDPPTLVLVSWDIDDSVGVQTLRRVAQSSEGGRLPRAVVCFQEAEHPGRAAVAEAGVIDFVFHGGEVDRPLLALIQRLVTRDLLESRLDATTRQFRTIVETSNDGIYIIQGGAFAYANPKFEAMVGFPLDELMAAGFSIEENIIAEQSRDTLRRRVERIEAGLPVAPRYDFVARRKDGQIFDAQVSISYVEFNGGPATLGIMQDITERKSFENEIIRKNREFALVGDVSTAINAARSLDEILDIGARRVHDLLRVAAVGISLLDPHRDTLELRAAKGLDAKLRARLQQISLQSKTLLADAVRRGVIQHVHNITDERVTIPEVRNAGYSGALVVPLRAEDKVVGAAFMFSDERPLTDADEELMRALGVLLGTAIDRASLLEAEQASVQRLLAIDEIAKAVSSRLDMLELAKTVARSLRRVFDFAHISIGKYDPDAQAIAPLLSAGPAGADDRTPLGVKGSLFEWALDIRAPVQLTAERDVQTAPPHARQLFNLGLGKVVAAPIVSDGDLLGGLLLGFVDSDPLLDSEIKTLDGLSTHLAIAMKNAALFAARDQALVDLQAAQDKLVQSEKLRALGELAAGVAHDFNNVLGAILGRAQLLKANLSDPGLKKHAEIIEKAANDGAETVRRVQELGRQDSTDDFVVVSVTEILDDVAEFTRPRWREQPLQRGVRVDLYVESRERDLAVRGNPHELREVLINLVHNAVDAMPDGGQVHLVATRDPGGDTCSIRVRDTGTGIPEDVKQRIFDPFFTTKGEKGTGLGLSVSYSIIQRHHGELEVHSVSTGPRHGTEFCIRLPTAELTTSMEDVGGSTTEESAPVGDAVDSVGGDEAGWDEWAAPAETSFGERGKVLVIDDEENIRDILTDFLSTEGFTVLTAADGPAGLELLEGGDFVMVFTDLGLPGLDGYEVAAEVKKRFANLPVCLVTGWGATLDQDLAKARGIDLILSKPFKFEQLLASVERVLDERAGS